MSTMYVLEPSTKGKVILSTSYGPLASSCGRRRRRRPSATLCSCDWKPTTTTPFSTALSNRFWFKAVIPPAPEKLTGDSIFNLLQLGEVETDKDNRPLDPLPNILSVEVLWNPFDDIVPWIILAKSLSASEKKEPKQKVTKKLNLLSFGEEAEEEEKELEAVNPRIRSSHDVLNDPRLLKEAVENDLKSAEGQKIKNTQLIVREALSSRREQRKELGSRSSESPDNSDEDEASFDAQMRQQILKEGAWRLAN